MAGKSELFNWNKAMNVGEVQAAIVILDRVVQRYAVEAGEKAKPMCPVATSTLQKSLVSSVQYKGKSFEVLSGKSAGRKLAYWVGSSLPYAAKQEFEHKTKSHFIHKGIKSVIEPMKKAANENLIKYFGEQWTKG